MAGAHQEFLKQAELQVGQLNLPLTTAGYATAGIGFQAGEAQSGTSEFTMAEVAVHSLPNTVPHKASPSTNVMMQCPTFWLTAILAIS